jgi:hypothetical protein
MSFMFMAALDMFIGSLTLTVSLDAVSFSEKATPKESAIMLDRSTIPNLERPFIFSSPVFILASAHPIISLSQNRHHR